MPRPPLALQKAVVTGGSSGIGRAGLSPWRERGPGCGNQLLFRRAGCRIGCRRVAPTGCAIIRKADASNEMEVRSLFELMLREFGTNDILPRQCRPAAGRPQSDHDPGTLEQGDLCGSDGSVSLRGKPYANFVARRGAGRLSRRRQVICRTSVPGNSLAGHVNYAAAKGGVTAMMRSMRGLQTSVAAFLTSALPAGRAVRAPAPASWWVENEHPSPGLSPSFRSLPKRADTSTRAGLGPGQVPQARPRWRRNW